jgi:hypothetical protein
MQLSERRLTNKLMEIHSLQKKGRYPPGEAKRLGQKAIRDAFKENTEIVNRMARAQGLKEAPIKLYDEKHADEAIEKWDSVVDDTAKLGASPNVPGPPGGEQTRS